MAEQGFECIFSKIRAGETVLVECSSISTPEILQILLHIMEKHCRKNSIPMLIDDVADTLSEFITRLELTGAYRIVYE